MSKEAPHSHAVRIKALKMTTVPRMDKKRYVFSTESTPWKCCSVNVVWYRSSRMTCRPYVEVHVNGDKVYTSVSKEDFSGLKQFSPSDGRVEIAMNVTVKGNVVVAVHHVKSVNSETNVSSVCACA